MNQFDPTNMEIGHVRVKISLIITPPKTVPAKSSW